MTDEMCLAAAGVDLGDDSVDFLPRGDPCPNGSLP
jgi:hypothetical protein